MPPFALSPNPFPLSPSAGEMVVGPAKVLLMDSISTGLDSSTTFLIVNCLKHICHFMDATVCISLLQPPPGTVMCMCVCVRGGGEKSC